MLNNNKSNIVIHYAENFTVEVKPVALKGGMPGCPGSRPGQGASGYGKKITTDYMVRFNDDPKKRLYRVYCVCFSNSGSLYVIKGKDTLYINSTEIEYQLEQQKENT